MPACPRLGAEHGVASGGRSQSGVPAGSIVSSGAGVHAGVPAVFGTSIGSSTARVSWAPSLLMDSGFALPDVTGTDAPRYT